MYGKVAAVAVVGDEDGAHHATAKVFQTLNDVGFTIPAVGGTYWVGEAMGKVDSKSASRSPTPPAPPRRPSPPDPRLLRQAQGSKRSRGIFLFLTERRTA